MLWQQASQLALVSAGSLSQLRRAAVAVLDLVEVLRLGSFRGSLSHETKDRYVLRFSGVAGCSAFDPSAEVVLKVYGSARRGEGPLQALWKTKGVPTPTVVHGVHSSCSWLLLEYVSLRPAGELSVAEQLLLTDELGAVSALMHEPAPQLSDILRPLHTVMLPRWSAAARTLSTSGRSIPAEWYNRAAAAYRCGETRPLHGDLGLRNVALNQEQRLAIIDASALSGPAVFDAARWAARLGAESPPLAVLERWSSLDAPMSRDSLMLLAAECVVEAGSLVTIAARSQQQDRVESHVTRMLGVASEIWSRR